MIYFRIECSLANEQKTSARLKKHGFEYPFTKDNSIANN